MFNYQRNNNSELSQKSFQCDDDGSSLRKKLLTL